MAIAVPVDPLKSYAWSIDVDDLVIAYCKQVQIPTMEVGIHEHGGAGSNFNTKTGARLAFGDVTLKKVMPSSADDKWAWDWLTNVQNPTLGIGVPPLIYKKPVIITHLTTQAIPRVGWNCLGCFVKKIEYSESDGESQDGAVIETVTLSVDWYERL